MKQKSKKKKQLQQKQQKESFILQNAFHTHLSYSQQQQLAEEHGKKRETHTHTTREEQKAPPSKREGEALDLKMYSFDQCWHRGSLKIY